MAVSRPTIGRSCALFGCLLLLSAGPQTTPDDLIREGVKAIEKGKYEQAMQLFQSAEERGTDPGLIAFNKAHAYWYLNDYRNAENHYRMALDDAAAPVDRRARAFYNLGNCLVKQSNDNDLRLLRDAIRYYEYCLDMTEDADLQRIAKHNLEVAKLKWNAARLANNNSSTPNSDEPSDTPRQHDTKKRPELEKKPDSTKQVDGKDPGKELDPKKTVDKGTEEKNPKADPNKTDAAPQAGPGRVPVIPDSDTFKAQNETDTRAALSDVEARLNYVRQRLRGLATIPEKPSGKDW